MRLHESGFKADLILDEALDLGLPITIVLASQSKADDFDSKLRGFPRERQSELGTHQVVCFQAG